MATRRFGRAIHETSHHGADLRNTGQNGQTETRPGWSDLSDILSRQDLRNKGMVHGYQLNRS